MLNLGILGSSYNTFNLGVEMLKLNAKYNISLNLGPIILPYLK